ncbi:MAG: hypothetical protein HN846_04625 [Candidatus Pacebacteria bacterium]|jgi:hypothetical protein|nr:hypothetical protein [Candidatus Paceibacterota bacterium]MBT3512226.1 hypothetical protein [Candidatus Paceibacterota bacterium]MBT4004544.1 hypothetical protein [Candidatus Paceibacterota bacterium]MBT4359208.1 hypothetical protein [Candidatus Paceibacterota bacterium]MBT4681094.1 hypothetical protein [Candidatus Paceibacterota bacterium]
MSEYASQLVINYLSREEIGELIDNNITFDTEVDFENTVTISMVYGSKKLELKILELNNPDVINTNSMISTPKGNDSVRTTGETTFLYQQAKKILQALANKNQRVKYSFITAAPILKLWAEEGGGVSLFQWDDISEKTYEDGSESTKTYDKYFFRQ